MTDEPKKNEPVTPAEENTQKSNTNENSDSCNCRGCAQKKNKSLFVILILLLIVASCWYCFCPCRRCKDSVCSVTAAPTNKTSIRQVLCTTYPVWLFTSELLKGTSLANPELLVPADTGCPHDYAVTPADMRKLTTPGTLIIANGAGLDDFLFSKIGRDLDVVRAVPSNPAHEHAEEAHEYAEEAHEHAEEAHEHAEEAHEHAEEAHEHAEEAHEHAEEAHEHAEEAHEHAEEAHEHAEHVHHHHHDHACCGGGNPHFFVRPKFAGEMCKVIASALESKVQSESDRAAIQSNLKSIQTQCDTLEARIASLAPRVKGKSVAVQHGAFEYLFAEDGLNLKTPVILHADEGLGLSASELKKQAEECRTNQVSVIFVEPQYSQETARTLMKETQLPLVELDPVASGPSEIPEKDMFFGYYQKIINQNLDKIETSLSRDAAPGKEQ